MARDIRAGRAFVELSTKDSELRKGLRNASRQLQTFGSDLRRVGGALAGVGVAILAPLGLAVKQFASLGDAVQKAALRTGLSTEAFSELSFAAEQSGASAETLEKGIRTMQRSVVDLGRGLSTQKDAFGTLGLAFSDLQGLAPEQQLKLISDRIAGVADPTQRAALAMQLFGRSGVQLLPLLASGARGMEVLQEQARELGRSIGQEAADGAADLTDALNELKTAVLAVAFNAGSALAPQLTGIARDATSAAVGIREYIAENARFIRGVTKAGAVVGGFGAVLIGLGAAVSAVGGGIAFLGAGPFVLLTAAVTAVPVAFVGLIAYFNDGEIAGVNLGRAILRLVDDLGLLNKVAARTSQALRLEEATQQANDYAAAVGKAARALNDATNAGERLAAQRKLVQTIEQQIAAQERLDAAERSAGVGQELIERRFGEAGFSITLSNTVRGFSISELQGRLKTEQSQIEGLISEANRELSDQQLDFDVELGEPVAEPDLRAALQRTRARVKSFYDGVASLVTDAQAEAREQIAESDFDIAVFTGTEQDKIRLNLERYAERLKADARALGRLTPQVAAEIDAAAAGQIAEQLESLQDRLGTTLRTLDISGTFDARGVAGLAGGPSQFEQRTAAATEETARVLRRIEPKLGETRFG